MFETPYHCNPPLNGVDSDELAYIISPVCINDTLALFVNIYAEVDAAHAAVSETSPFPANPDTNVVGLSQSKQFL